MPAWFINLAFGLFFNWLAFITRPTPEPPKAATFEEARIPVAEQGREVGKIYGTIILRSFHVAYHGDFRTRAIRESQGKKG